MATNSTTPPFDINQFTVGARKPAGGQSADEDRRRAAIDPAAARRVKAAEAKAKAQPVTRPVTPAPVTVIRPVTSAAPAGASPIQQLRDVLGSIGRRPEDAGRPNNNGIAVVTAAQAAELLRLADWLDHNERHGADQVREIARGSGALRFDTVQRVLADVDFALAPPKGAA